MTRAIEGLAHATAIIGGLVLLGLIIMTTVSVAGRETGIGEILGNYEILEAGVGFAIFSFYPICHLYSSHATVDVFTAGLSTRSIAVIRAFWEVVLTAIIILLSWRLYGGLERYLNNGETTLFLQFPVWWAYAASFAASVVTCVTAIWCAIARIIEAATGKNLLPGEI